MARGGLLHSRRQVEKDSLQPELLRQMAGQRLEAQRLGGVVTAVDDVEAVLGGVVEEAVTGLAGDEGVEAGVGDIPIISWHRRYVNTPAVFRGFV
jgi:predicted ATP-dependent serine protease